MAKHLRFVARTVMVRNNDINEAHASLKRFLSQDGVIDAVNRKLYYEKPCRMRQRKNFDSCKRIYNTEMARKIAFISRTSRADPWLGC